MKAKMLISCISLLLSHVLLSQTIPANYVIKPSHLYKFLKTDVANQFPNTNAISEKELAHYFKDKFSERYFYNWKIFNQRFKFYNLIYPSQKSVHFKNANDLISKFKASTPWILPFNYKNGKPVNAYGFRHLSRQHKMVDIALCSYYQNNNETYLKYFQHQLQSLNYALEANQFEKIKDGNGVYEAFRSGYRVLNWLQVHNMFLADSIYSDKNQLTTIATLLQHGAKLYQDNIKYNPGNHQTRGMSTLAMISILLRDFKGTDLWYKRAMSLLEEHLSKEINNDGFQFERSIHYHISDIENYFYVYQLAIINKLKVSPFWENNLKSLFTTLIKIAYPDKSAPVAQDDTNIPWAEKNDISGALTLGYILFEDPTMGYFANNKVEPKMYWFLNQHQLNLLKNIRKEQPHFGSLSFPTTGYYISREGWHKNDKMMLISSGVDKNKSDHQHGDVFGVQAMAFGKVILPNYQVRYSLKDLEFFKNSMVKNVALVDDAFQGKKYVSNKGGSGFGKFKELPDPKVITWKTNKTIDVFVGSHNGFKNVGVTYSRQVIFVKNDFWIVKDNFLSDKIHNYKQVWQGHYTLEEAPNLLRAVFDDASGLDIYQIKKTDTVITSGKRGKQWSIVSKQGEKEFSFITILYPYKGYSNRIDEENNNPKFKAWELNNSKWKVEGVEPISLTKKDKSVFFGVKKLELNNIKIAFSDISDVFVTFKNDVLSIQSIGEKESLMSIKNKHLKKNIVIKPGETIEYAIK